MRTYLINLGRRPDRLDAMTKQLDRLGIAFVRFAAIDAKAADSTTLDQAFAAGGPLGELSPGDKACTLSHLEVLRRIAKGEDSHGAVLEDDILLSEEAPKFLSSSDWIPKAARLIKLELFGNSDQLFVIENRRIPILDRELAPLLSRHTGGGAYIVSRETAAVLVGMGEKLTLPIDHLLFNPSNSAMFDWLKPLQLLPAIAVQRDEIGRGTDIHGTRQAIRPRGWALVRRQIARAFYDVRLLPKQVAAVLTGRARLIKIKFV